MSKVVGHRASILKIFSLEFDWLEEAAEVSFAELEREWFLKATKTYLTEAAFLESAPKTSKVRERFKELAKVAQKLAVLLKDKSPLGEVVEHYGFPYDLVQPAELIKILSCLAEISRTSAKLLVKSKGGADSKYYLHEFVLSIAYVYDHAGGKTKGACYSKGENYAGPLFRLVCELLTQIREVGGPDFKPRTVGKWLKNRRKKWSGWPERYRAYLKSTVPLQGARKGRLGEDRGEPI